jgi:hypothetical protein
MDPDDDQLATESDDCLQRITCSMIRKEEIQRLQAELTRQLPMLQRNPM